MNFDRRVLGNHDRRTCTSAGRLSEAWNGRRSMSSIPTSARKGKDASQPQ